MSEPKRDFTNSFDDMFDFDHDGKIDFLEQYAEIDYLSEGRIRPEDADLAHDYLMHSDDPDITFPASFAVDYDDDDDFDDFDSDDYASDDHDSDDYDD